MFIIFDVLEILRALGTEFQRILKNFKKNNLFQFLLNSNLDRVLSLSPVNMHVLGCFSVDAKKNIILGDKIGSSTFELSIMRKN